MPIYTQASDPALLDPKKLSQSLLLAIDEATRAAERYEERAASVWPSPDKWSVKEVFGHLIDSAGNNLQRIVRLSLQPALDLPGYDGEAWVAMQHYADRPWSEVVTLWRAESALGARDCAGEQRAPGSRLALRGAGLDARLHHRGLHCASAAPCEGFADYLEIPLDRMSLSVPLY
jgi:hypothetical protein